LRIIIDKNKLASEYQDKEALNKTKNGETTVSDLTFAQTEGVCNFVKNSIYP